VGDSGRPTYDALKQKLAEKDAQLDEALAIIKELTDTMQGKATPAAVQGVCPTCGTASEPPPAAAPPPAAGETSTAGMDHADVDEVNLDRSSASMLVSCTLLTEVCYAG
jgi:hypothetical protein